jgi:hypothetical protein
LSLALEEQRVILPSLWDRTQQEGIIIYVHAQEEALKEECCREAMCRSWKSLVEATSCARRLDAALDIEIFVHKQDFYFHDLRELVSVSATNGFDGRSCKLVGLFLRESIP